MDLELEKKLFEKYPKIFAQKDESMQRTAMCWGIECGNGWYWLIDNLCDSIQFHIDHNKALQLEATQVKEKFGSLSFYSIGGDELIRGMIWFAQSLSRKICENCGTTKDVKSTKGWIHNLCPSCTEEYLQSKG